MLLTACFGICAGKATVGDDNLADGRQSSQQHAAPHWRVMTKPASPVMLAECDDSDNQVASYQLLESSSDMVAFSFDGHQSRLAISTSDKKIHLWSLKASRTPARTSLEVESPAAPAVILRLSPDGQWMASGDNHGRITLWNLRDSDAGYSNLRRPWISQPVDILEFSPDGLWLFCASNDANKYLYFAKLWKLGEDVDAKDGIRLNANTYPFESAQFAPGGRWFITGHNNGPRIWDLHSVDPSRNPIVVGSTDIQRQVIELADGTWRLQDGGSTLAKPQSNEAAAGVN